MITRLAEIIFGKTGGFKHSSTEIRIDTIDPSVWTAIVSGLIDPEDLWVDEAENGIESDPHITVLYGLLTSDPEDVESVVSGFGPVRVKIDKVSYFEPDGRGYDVVIGLIDSADLCTLHNLIAENLEYKSDFEWYQPHITLAYVKKGLGKKYDGVDFEYLGLESETSTLYFSDTEGNKTQIQLED